MIKPADYDYAPSYDSENVRLPAGGYLCQIRGMEEDQTKTGTPIIHVYFDICEGNFTGYYEKMYRRNKSEAKNGAPVKWKGVYDVFPVTRDGGTSGQWKGLLTNIEKSNGYRVNWSADYQQFKGKKIGLLMREEEYYSRYDGSKRSIVKACASRPYDTIREGEFEIPAKKEAKPINEIPASVSSDFQPVEVADDELPF